MKKLLACRRQIINRYLLGLFFLNCQFCVIMATVNKLTFSFSITQWYVNDQILLLITCYILLQEATLAETLAIKLQIQDLVRLQVVCVSSPKRCGPRNWRLRLTHDHELALTNSSTSCLSLVCGSYSQCLLYSVFTRAYLFNLIRVGSKKIYRSFNTTSVVSPYPELLMVLLNSNRILRSR